MNRDTQSTRRTSQAQAPMGNLWKRLIAATSTAVVPLASFGAAESVAGDSPCLYASLVKTENGVITSIEKVVTHGAGRSFYPAFDKLTNLQGGWDGEDADPPNRYALATAKDLLSLLIDNNQPPSKVIPCIDGGVTFLFYNGPRMVAVEILNTGEVAYAISAGPGRTTAGELIPSEQAFSQLIEEISAGIG